MTATPPPTAPASNASATPQPAATATCAEPSGQLLEDSYPAVAVAGEVPLLVYLPPCYADGESRYPTAYLLHGLPYDQRHWLDLGAVEVFETGLLEHGWPLMLLVMPYQPEPLFTSTDGGPGSYEEEFMQGLVPYVERSYGADPALRALAGISRGGIWALEIAFRHPADFAALAVLSPALAVNSARPAYDPLALIDTFDRLPYAVLLLAGESDWAALGTENLSQIMRNRGIEHEFALVPGDHNDSTWAGAMPDVFGFLSQALSRP